MGATYRELFDEQERNEIMLAMQAREAQMRSRLKACRRAESSKGASTADRLEANIEEVNGIIRTLAEESN